MQATQSSKDIPTVLEADTLPANFPQGVVDEPSWVGLV